MFRNVTRVYIMTSIQFGSEDFKNISKPPLLGSFAWDHVNPYFVGYDIQSMINQSMIDRFLPLLNIIHACYGEPNDKKAFL